jgi:hypothetical protein
MKTGKSMFPNSGRAIIREMVKKYEKRMRKNQKE